MSTQQPNSENGTDPVRGIARTITVDYADVFLGYDGVPCYEEWDEVVDTIELSLAEHIESEVRA